MCHIKIHLCQPNPVIIFFLCWTLYDIWTVDPHVPFPCKTRFLIFLKENFACRCLWDTTWWIIKWDIITYFHLLKLMYSFNRCSNVFFFTYLQYEKQTTIFGHTSCIAILIIIAIIYKQPFWYNCCWQNFYSEEREEEIL